MTGSAARRGRPHTQFAAVQGGIFSARGDSVGYARCLSMKARVPKINAFSSVMVIS